MQQVGPFVGWCLNASTVFPPPSDDPTTTAAGRAIDRSGNWKRAPADHWHWRPSPLAPMAASDPAVPVLEEAQDGSSSKPVITGNWTPSCWSSPPSDHNYMRFFYCNPPVKIYLKLLQSITCKVFVKKVTLQSLFRQHRIPSINLINILQVSTNKYLWV